MQSETMWIMVWIHVHVDGGFISCFPKVYTAPLEIFGSTDQEPHPYWMSVQLHIITPTSINITLVCQICLPGMLSQTHDLDYILPVTALSVYSMLIVLWGVL